MAKRQAVVDRMARAVPPWTRQQVALFGRVAAKTRPGIPYTHDLSDDNEFEFALLQHGGRAFLKKHFPGTLYNLERSRQTAAKLRGAGIDPRPRKLSTSRTSTTSISSAPAAARNS